MLLFSYYAATPLPGNGDIANGGFQVTILGTPLSTDVVTTLMVGKIHHIEVSKIPNGAAETATNETSQPFRGFLLRLDGGIDENNAMDTTGAFSGNFFENAQVADICLTETPPVGGLTHTSNDAKNVSGSNLILDQPTATGDSLTLDVTIVVRSCDASSPLAPAPNDIVTPCDPAESIYYYSAFKINVIAEDDNDGNGDAATPPTESPATPTSTAAQMLLGRRCWATMTMPLVALMLPVFFLVT
jgi:hypothetical protein